MWENLGPKDAPCQMVFRSNKPARTGLNTRAVPAKSRSQRKTKMKSSKIATIGLGLVLMLGLAGCAGMKPQRPEYYGAMARLVVDAALWENPNERAKVALAARMLCDATRSDSLAPVTFEHALNADNFSRETVAVIRGVQLIYIAAIATLPDTNRATYLSYAEEVFCGLADVPSSGTVMRGLPSPPKFKSDPRFRVSVKRD